MGHVENLNHASTLLDKTGPVRYFKWHPKRMKTPFLSARKKLLLAFVAGLWAAGSASAVMITWVGTNGISATTNWSDANNWNQINTFTHVSPANNAANFTWMTAVSSPGLVTVNVDGAYGAPGVGPAQSYGAFFGQTNAYHTVFIQPGITWALQASAATPGIGLSVGPQPTNNNNLTNVYLPGVTYTNYTKIEGVGGTLFIDGVGLRVEGGSTVVDNHYSILDLSGLGTFIMTNNMQGQSSNVSSNSFFLVNGASNSQGLVYLALTNVITLIDSFQVGFLGGSSNSLPIGVYLGQSNYIYTGASNNNLVIGAMGCTNGFLRFNPALLGGASKPAAVLTGYGGSQNVTICGANGGVVPGYAICDLTGGNVTWSANTMSLGVSGASGVSANGVLTFDTGTITANTIMAGVQPNSAGGAGMGTINIGANATLQVNSQLLLGNITGITTAGTAGTINITGGTLAANTVATGGGAGVINMTNGNWNVALESTGTNIIVTTFSAAGSVNTINITSIPPILVGGFPIRFHLIAANLSGTSTLRLGSLPASPEPSNPYAGYLDATTTPGLVDFVLTGGPAPSAAAALGYTLCVINEKPTASDIAPGSKGNYKWFSGQWWETPPPLSDYSSLNNALTLSLGGELVSTPRDFSTGATPVLPGSNGFYVEFDMQLSDNGSDHWPGVWLMPVENNAQQQDCYPNLYPSDPPDFERCMEFDVEEGGWGPGLLGTVHFWTGVQPNETSISNPNNESPIPLDLSQKHTFGGSYDPVHQTVSWWVDGVYQMSAGAPYVPAVAALQHFYMILSAYSHGANTPYTMSISGVRAYVPAAGFSLQLVMPVVQSASMTARSFTFTSSALPGQLYQVQCSTNLRAQNWVNLGSPITATSSTLSVSDSVTNTQEYYRVIWLQ
jgi:hypothetical protein